MATLAASPSALVPKIRRTQLLIDGKWRDSASGNTFATINPATEEVIAQISEGNEADIDAAVKAARRALEKDVAVVDARLSKFEDHKAAVKTNQEYTALLHEIATAKSEKDAVEEHLQQDQRGDCRAFGS